MKKLLAVLVLLTAMPVMSFAGDRYRDSYRPRESSYYRGGGGWGHGRGGSFFGLSFGFSSGYRSSYYRGDYCSTPRYYEPVTYYRAPVVYYEPAPVYYAPAPVYYDAPPVVYERYERPVYRSSYYYDTDPGFSVSFGYSRYSYRR